MINNNYKIYNNYGSSPSLQSSESDAKVQCKDSIRDCADSTGDCTDSIAHCADEETTILERGIKNRCQIEGSWCAK